jgi:ATP-binding protein involved in chromosome partitioning
LTQQIALTGAVVVSTPQDLALIDARRGIDMFRKVNVPIVGIIENMSYYICPNCGAKSDIFGCGGAEETAKQYSVPFLGGIPLHKDIRSTSDAGTPITVSDPKNPAAEPYFKIAQAIARQLDEGLLSAQSAGPTITMDS